MIYVSPLSAVHDAIRKHAPSHLVSLLDPDTMIETPEGFDPARHLRIGVNDIAEPIDDLARQIRDSAPHAHPNRLMVTLADDALGRGGRMVAAVDALGPGRAAWEGMLFGLPIRLEEG